MAAASSWTGRRSRGRPRRDGHGRADARRGGRRHHGARGRERRAQLRLAQLRPAGDNFSAVGYPTVYPWQAWPNIGPPYPYPEVPLDWRAVTLRWDDGIWWLDFKKHYTRPFFTPYPFGIFAY